MSIRNRIKRLEKVHRLSKNTDHLLIIMDYGEDNIREQDLGESLEEYMYYLDNEGIEYVQIKA
ncbi:hypothetical protein AWM68_07285 [Fictibacillus phosphorivorans]|uniref:Uncharacterized protein n=1 Tax=Fictibacillus phosphorivorans TaxID=1221500 RepID=A0A163R4B5_9BACL|nr:hypothetical protein [Fictibacillus phosphorivorans]KZE66169.1 hypothetical protein AWM68_07285 [Fictibacillus phosphorivorans]